MTEATNRSLISKAFSAVGRALREANEREMATNRYLFSMNHYPLKPDNSLAAVFIGLTAWPNSDGSLCKNRMTCPFHGPDADDYRSYLALQLAKEQAESEGVL